MALRLTAAALAAVCASSMAAPCSDKFLAGLDTLRVNEVCNYMKTFETCVDGLTGNEMGSEMVILRKSQMRFGCLTAKVARRQAGNGNIDLSSNPIVNRQRRESVSIFNLNDAVGDVKVMAAATKKTVDQVKKDSNQMQTDINLAKTDIVRTNDATLAVARIDEQVKLLDSLSETVDSVESDIKGLSSNLAALKSDLEKSNGQVKTESENKLSTIEGVITKGIDAAVAAANEAKVAAASKKLNAETLPAGAIVQVVDRKNENPGGHCSNGWCVSLPHYGNRMGSYRKTPLYIEIVAMRDNSWYQFAGNQYFQTAGGSHFYVDFKRTVNGGGEKSLTQELRQSSITDELTGGHPSRRLGTMVSPVFLDQKAKAKKSQKVRYTLWVASWNSGRVYLDGHNSNEQSLNWYTLSEIAQ